MPEDLEKSDITLNLGNQVLNELQDRDRELKEIRKESLPDLGDPRIVLNDMERVRSFAGQLRREGGLKRNVFISASPGFRWLEEHVLIIIERYHARLLITSDLKQNPWFSLLMMMGAQGNKTARHAIRDKIVQLYRQGVAGHRNEEDAEGKEVEDTIHVPDIQSDYVLRMVELGNRVFSKASQSIPPGLSTAQKLRMMGGVLDGVQDFGLMAHLIYRAGPAYKIPLFDILTEAWSKGGDDYMAQQISRALKMETDNDGVFKDYFKQSLTKLGLYPTEMRRVVDGVFGITKGFLSSPYYRGAFMHKALSNARSVEEARPGGLRQLAEWFGIARFHLFEPEELIAQFDAIDDRIQPYSMVVLGLNDHNGVETISLTGGAYFMQRLTGGKDFNQQMDEMWEPPLKQWRRELASKGYTIRVMEAKSYQEATQRMHHVLTRNTKVQKGKSGALVGPSFLYCHSNQYGLTLDNDVSGEPFITAEEITADTSTAQKEILQISGGAPLVLIGCSSSKARDDKQEPVASSLANSLGLTVYAFNFPVASITPKLSLDVDQKGHISKIDVTAKIHPVLPRRSAKRIDPREKRK